MNKKHNEKMKARKKPIKGKYNALIPPPGTNSRNKNPIGTKKPGNVLLDQMQRIELRGLEL